MRTTILEGLRVTDPDVIETKKFPHINVEFTTPVVWSACLGLFAWSEAELKSPRTAPARCGQSGFPRGGLV